MTREGEKAQRLWIAAGARAAERALLDRVHALGEEARRDPALLARPVRIVVPSRSLREHLAARLVREAPNGALAGVAVQTHRGAAWEVLRRRGGPPKGDGQHFFPILVRRLAREEPALWESLEPLHDGYGAVTAAVTDLLDAGMETAHAEALEDALEQGPPGGARERARAVVRVARRALDELAAGGLAHRSGLLREATDALMAEPALLPARSILIHGFADVTGAAGDWLEALVRHGPAWGCVDHPPDPAGEAEAAPGVDFTRRLLERFERAAGQGAAPASSSRERPQLCLLRASGGHGEARAVAERIASLREAGARYESIGIVARDLSPYRAPLAIQLRRVGVPFSGGRGLVGPVGRRLRGLLELLERGDACPADRWLDAGRERDRLQDAELRLALHSLGAGRLGQVADLDLGGRLSRGGGLPLPVQLGLAKASTDGSDEDRLPAAARPKRRYADGKLLASVAREAGRVCAALGRMQDQHALDALLGSLRWLLADGLDWIAETPGRTEVDKALASFEQSLPGNTRLDASELRSMLARALRSSGATPLGGAGGGVQVMDVTAARSRTFDYLFVLGMNREVFPRTIPEDPLLPDELRQRIESVLESMPLKRRSFDEERYLFAQLCSAAPHVCLSWQELSDEGRERPPSPLVERLRLARAAEELPPAPPALAARSDDVPRPAFEHAIRVALGAGASSLPVVLPPALEGRLEASAALRLAEARGRALAEQDPRDARRHRLGPFHGFVGAPPSGDPREASPWVTFLEAEARCPWQVFLQRILALEPRPDALQFLPAAESAPVGTVVHRVLEAIAARAGVENGGTLAEALGREAVAVPWPEPAVLREEIERAARDVARLEGLAHPAAAVLLARRARPCLERIREVDWGGGDYLPGVLGVELDGEVAVRDGRGRELALRFRADRADRIGSVPERFLRLTDYKTGRPDSEAKKQTTRDRKLRQAVANGRRLQAAAYAFCEPGTTGVGRYLFARPDVDPEHAVARIEGNDEDARRVFEAAVGALVDLRREGAFVPRLVQGPGRDLEPRACGHCQVAEACHRGETGARQRLVSWLGRDEAQQEGESDAERAARAVLAMEDGR